jgi:hypothetical protein
MKAERAGQIKHAVAGQWTGSGNVVHEVEFLEREYARFDGDSYLEAGSVSRRAALSWIAAPFTTEAEQFSFYKIG